MKLVWTRSGMPHGYLCDVPIHLIYRLEGCLPVHVVQELTTELLDQLSVLEKLSPPVIDRISKVKEQYFLAYDRLLDAQDQSKYILAHAEIAQVVLDSWKTLAARGKCKIHVVCIMGNHVHVLLERVKRAEETPVGLILRQHKTWTDRVIQRELSLDHKVWARGFFDRYVRPRSLEDVFHYILSNPVKAGLIRDGRDWPFTWIPNAGGI
ncbi:MAG: transposase [Saprospiraceae bacterium]